MSPGMFLTPNFKFWQITRTIGKWQRYGIVNDCV